MRRSAVFHLPPVSSRRHDGVSSTWLGGVATGSEPDDMDSMEEELAYTLRVLST
jgi:hypothetical protein